MIDANTIKRMMKSGEIVEINIVLQLSKVNKQDSLDKLYELYEICFECAWRIECESVGSNRAKILMQPCKMS